MTALSEADRLADLRLFDVLDTAPEQVFDDLVAAAAETTGCPTALVSLLDENRQWFKARCGLDVRETSRDVAFCDHVLRAGAPLVVPDATADPRFSANPLVTGPLGIRFYAGFPLRATSGAVLGTLCVVDYTPRPGGLSPAQHRMMTVLAAQVMTQLELRRTLAERNTLLHDLRLAVDNYRVLAEDATDIVSRHRLDGTTLFVSPSVRTVLGYDPDAEIGQAAPDRVHLDDAARMGAALGQVLGGTATTVAFRSRHADGSWRHLDVRLSPIRDETGTVVQIHSVARDATEQAVAQEQLRLSENRFRVLFDSNPVGQVELDPAGVVQRVNVAFADLLGVPDPALLIGRTPAWATPPAERAGQGQTLSAAVAEPGQVVHSERTIVRADGTAVEIAGTLVGVAGPDGKTALLIGSVVDVTERNRVQRQLSDLATALAAARDEAVERNALVETVLETVSVGIVACDAEGRLTLFNRMTRAFHGMPADPTADPADWADRYALFDEDGTTVLTRERVPLIRALVEGSVEDAVIVIAPQGLPARVVRCEGRAMHDPDGRLLGAVVVMTDVTEARASARALAEQAEFTRILLDRAHTAIWSFDKDLVPAYVNAKACDVLGWPDLATLTELHERGELAQLMEATTVVGADNRVLSQQERPLQQALDGHDSGEIELLVTAPGRPGRTLLVHASPLHDSNGAVSGAMVTGHDVTELRASEARFRAAFHDGPTPVARLDRHGVILEINPALRRLTGRRSRALIGHQLVAQAHPADRVRLARVLAGPGTGPTPVEFRILRVDGTPVWCEGATTVSTGADGVETVLAQFLDVDARKTQELALEKAAGRDPLTSLANRSQLTALTESLLDGGREVKVGLLFLDLDGFKSVNDTFGHDAGDAVLVEVAQRLTAAVRPGDTALRLGGDEFLVVAALPVTDAAPALDALAIRLERAVTQPIAFRESSLQVGVSVGTALAQPGQPLAELVQAADRAMYVRKQEGRAARR